MKRTFSAAFALLSAAVLVVGCSGSNTDTSSETTAESSATSAEATGEITVFAAASLKSTFTALGTQLEETSPSPNSLRVHPQMSSPPPTRRTWPRRSTPAWWPGNP
jgi:ABC-type molybdate transport system substrate-binding protein